MTQLREQAPAKINLFLHVTGRRDDGYHLLQSLAVFVPGASDVLHAEPAEELSLQIRGPFARGLENEKNNLVLRAATALRDAAGITQGVALTLEKHLPIASGIGGGSADAAAALRLLSRLWNVPVPDALAHTLGSDVPACLAAHPLYMEGVGEKLTSARLDFTLPLVLVNPGVPVSTAEVYRAITPPYRTPISLPPSWNNLQVLVDWLRDTHNDLELPALRLAPIINKTLETLAAQKNCLLSRMSGSGATCFGIFSNSEEAERAAYLIRSHRPDWWVAVT